MLSGLSILQARRLARFIRTGIGKSALRMAAFIVFYLSAKKKKMKTVKVPGLDIKIPPGSAFKIETPLMMSKMHLLAAVVAPRGYGKGVITTNLIEQLKVVD